MGEKIIVLVSDRDDNKHGEISVLDDAHKAERLVETLLEAGFEEERIRVFSGTASEFEISHRPVVSLVGEDSEDGEGERESTVQHDSRETEAEGEDRGAHAEAAARETEDRGGRVEVAARETENPPAETEAVEADRQEETAGDANEEEQVPADTEAGAPVRFSSLFRSS